MIKTYHFESEKGLVNGVEPGKPVEGTLLWTDMESPDKNDIDILESKFNFHPLAIEDCIKTMQRSKFDDYGDYCFIVLHSIADSQLGRKINVRELAVFIGLNYLVTFHHEPVAAVSQVRERIEKNPQLMSKGVDYILYLIVDAVVDEYFPVLGHLDDMLRAVIGMRKILSPHREMINALIRYEGVFIKQENMNLSGGMDICGLLA